MRSHERDAQREGRNGTHQGLSEDLGGCRYRVGRHGAAVVDLGRARAGEVPDGPRRDPALRGRRSPCSSTRTTAAPLATPARCPSPSSGTSAPSATRAGRRGRGRGDDRPEAGDVVDATQNNVYVMDRRTLQNVADDGPTRSTRRTSSTGRAPTGLNLPFDTSTPPRRTTSTRTRSAPPTRCTATRRHPDDRRWPACTCTTSPGRRTRCRSTALPGGAQQVVPLPESMTLEQLKPQLLAAGLDVDAVLAAIAPVITPADLDLAGGDLPRKPIPLQYVLSFEGTAAVETTTGAEVDVGATESVGARPVLADLPRCRRSCPTTPTCPRPSRRRRCAADAGLGAGRQAVRVPLRADASLGRRHRRRGEVDAEPDPTRRAVRAGRSAGRGLSLTAFDQSAPSSSVAPPSRDRPAHPTRTATSRIPERSTVSSGAHDERAEGDDKRSPRTMREATGPTMEPLPPTAHLLQPVIERAADDPGRAGRRVPRRRPLRRRDRGGVPTRVRAARQGLHRERRHRGRSGRADVAHTPRVAARRLRHPRRRRGHRPRLRDLVRRAAAVDPQRQRSRRGGPRDRRDGRDVLDHRPRHARLRRSRS